MLFNDWAIEYFENQKSFVKESTLGVYLKQYNRHIKDYCILAIKKLDIKEM